jgi:hypothetical protein
VLIGGAEATSLRRGRNVWMALDGQADCSTQLRHRWERVCHEAM